MKLDALVQWYQTLSPETLAQIADLYQPQAHFRDPFNAVQGVDAIRAIFEHMFQTTQAPGFSIREVQREGQTAWLSWDFVFGLRGRLVQLEGVTRLDFAEDGRVSRHLDYWDASDLYAQLPLLGRLIAFLRARLRTPL